jgi:hypothetical protein
MSLKRDAYKKWFSFDEFAILSCPSCSKGKISPIKESIIEKETLESIAATEYQGHDPLNYLGRFSFSAKCTNPKCDEKIFVLGYTSIEPDYQEGPNNDFNVVYETVYSPKFISPTIPIINLDSTYPQKLKDELEKSFELFWTDFSACGNRIRSSLELMLDDFKISRVTQRKKFKSLHTRIDEFKTKYAKYNHVIDKLFAIKWLGNAASHKSELSSDDIYDAYEILQYVLDEIFSTKRDSIEKLTKAINKKKGSIRKKK